MINTSNEYKEKIQNDRKFILSATVTLADSTVLELDDTDIMQGGMSFDEATSGTGIFQVGAAIIGENKIVLSNFDGKFDDYDFTGARVIPYVGLKLSQSVERLKKGVFNADDPQSRGNVITLESLDNLSKFERPFSEVDINFPCTALQLLQATCTHCGVVLNTVSFTNSGFTITSRPDDTAINCLDVVSFIAQISGSFAKCNTNGALELRWYDNFPNVLDGNTEPNADIVDGNGNTDILDGNTTVNYHHLYTFKNTPTVALDDVVITGIKVTTNPKEGESESVLFGTEGYVLELTNNPLIDTKAKATTIANSVGAKIVGMRFRPLSFNALTDPSVESGDIAFVSDRKGNSYNALLTHVNFTSNSGMTISCDAETPSRNSSVRYSAQTKAIVKARENVKKELTSYDIAVITLTESIVNGLGLYQTVIGDELEGRIIYQHDKPTMEQSVKRWFRTSEGYIQQTRPNTSSAWVTTSGQDIYGNAVYNTIATRGLSAEWIIAGIIASANNSSWFNLDANSFSYANGALKYSPANGFEIDTPNTKLKDGNLTANNIKGSNVDLSGKITATSGSFTGAVTATSGSFSGSITSPNANITGGSINMNTSSELSGLIQLNYGTYSSRISPAQLRFDSASYRGVVGHQTHYIADASGNIISSMNLSGLYTTQNITASGTKNRVVKTKNYGEVLLNAYETPRPTFADTGHGTIGEDGLCYVDIESVFYETIDTTHDYRYFLTKYGQGDLWIDKELSTKEYFVVAGTPNLEFDWKIEAIQRDYNTHNLEKFDNPIEKEETETDYTSLASNYLEEYEKELILC